MKNPLTYTTDPSKRCKDCKGREVKSFIGDTLLTNNLLEVDGVYECKDKKECKANVDAENTQVIISNRGYKILDDFGECLMEVEFEKEEMMWGGKV